MRGTTIQSQILCLRQQLQRTKNLEIYVKWCERLLETAIRLLARRRAVLSDCASDVLLYDWRRKRLKVLVAIERLRRTASLPRSSFWQVARYYLQEHPEQRTWLVHKQPFVVHGLQVDTPTYWYDDDRGVRWVVWNDELNDTTAVVVNCDVTAETLRECGVERL